MVLNFDDSCCSDALVLRLQHDDFMSVYYNKLYCDKLYPDFGKRGVRMAVCLWLALVHIVTARRFKELLVLPSSQNKRLILFLYLNYLHIKICLKISVPR
jgi:hypothetical protein